MANYSGLNFTYGDFDTKDYGVVIATLDGDRFSDSDTLGASEYTYSTGAGSNIFNITSWKQTDALTFELTIGSLNGNGLSPYEVSQIQHALTKTKNYQKLNFYDSVEHRDYYYNCIMTSFSGTYANGHLITLSFSVICDSPYAYSMDEEIINLTSASSYSIVVESQLDYNIVPYIELKTGSSGGNINIANATTGNNMSFTSLNARETVKIYENHEIKSSLGENVYRLKDCNCDFFTLCEGINNISITGDIEYVKIVYTNRLKLGV